MDFQNATNYDPLTHCAEPLSFESSFPEAAKLDFAIFRDLLHATHMTYHGFMIHHNKASSFRGSRDRYYTRWRRERAKILANSEKIKAEEVALYNKWGTEGTPRLWDTLEGLGAWWDAVDLKVDSWISEIRPLERPILTDWQEVQELPRTPAPQIAQWLVDEMAASAAKKAQAEAEDHAQLAKPASQSTNKSTPEKAQSLQRRFETLGPGGMREQTRSDIAPSNSRTGQREPVAGPTQTDWPSNRGTIRKPDDAEAEDVVQPQTHRRHVSSTSTASEITENLQAMRISQSGRESAPAMIPAVQPSAGNVATYHSNLSTTGAPSDGTVALHGRSHRHPDDQTKGRK